jgi:hypothetical protein
MVRVRYTLVSHETAVIDLLSDTPFGRSGVGGNVVVSRGTGEVTITQFSRLTPPPTTYEVAMSPTLETVKTAGYTCWIRLVRAEFEYAR